MIKIGQKIGPFTVVALAPRRSDHHSRFIGQCFCGRRKNVNFYNAGRSKSCGCKTKEIQRAAKMTHGHCKLFGKETKVYKAWRSMLKRCLDQHHKSFKRYGGRGIKICRRWKRFENFLADMGEPKPKFSLGRIDNDLGYSKNNCRWETAKQQANNRANSRLLKLNGETLTISQWAEKIGMPHCTISRRLRLGWSIAKALTKPPRRQKNSVCDFKPPQVRKGENYKLAI